jgi:hypothetical protein
LAREREFYRFHLLHGGPEDATEGRQQQLAELLESTLGQKDFAWSMTMVGSIAKEARTHGQDWELLANHLGRIRTSESVLSPVSVLFTHLLGLHGKSVEAVTKRLREKWGQGLRTVDPGAFAELQGEIQNAGQDDTTTGDRWVGIANALAKGEYVRLLDLLVEQNKSVMTARGGAPWIEKRHGNLHVRFRDEHGLLPSLNKISAVWRFPYFLDSLRSVASALKEN